MSTEGSALERERTMPLEQAQAELATAREENAELRDKYLRAAASIENARKQAERDAELRINQRLRSLYGRLLEVADNLERVLVHAPEGDPLRQGVQATLSQLQMILRQEGVTPINVEIGAAFDPQVHEAISTHMGDVEHPIVAQVLQRGYMSDGQVLRPARVVVTIPARAT